MTNRPRSGSKRPTLKDVAALAGVDKSLVSRVVNADLSITIPDSTRQRILDAVQEVGYRPSAAARGLRTHRSHAIGLVLPDLSNPVYAPIAQGAQSRGFETGNALLLVSDDKTDERQLVATLSSLAAEDRVDGLIVAAGDRSSQLLRAVQGFGKPVVMANRAVEGLSSVTVDDEEGAFVGVLHLILQGHTRVAHLAGPREVETSSRRYIGYKRALRHSGLVVDGRVTWARGWSASDGYRAGLRLLQRSEPTAVFAANVMLAVGLYRAAHDLGLTIPDDLSVVALHDFELAAMLVPALTTVEMPLVQLGRSAVDLLVDEIEGRELTDLVIEQPPVLLERESVASG
jgi:DNA-binding LacI/PurR family transcriptional regulator